MFRWMVNTNKLYKSLLRENVIHINVYHRNKTMCIEHKLLNFFKRDLLRIHSIYTCALDIDIFCVKYNAL